jgi:hypothetical protein
MGFLDELKDKAEEFGEKVKEGSGASKDKSEVVVENTKDPFESDNTVADKADDAAAFSTEAVSDAAEGINRAVTEDDSELT